MVNKKPELSTKAQLLIRLRENNGDPVNGNTLAKEMGVSRVAVWKGIQSLAAAGYAIETGETGYLLNPKKNEDFLYPWEFGEKETMFRHFMTTGSTMDRAREAAAQGARHRTVITAEKQTAGRGRNGRAWASRQGGLFFTILERPKLALADYTAPSLVLQIAVARALSAVCGKEARLRWPNDIYLGQRKIAGIITEISGEGDLVNWLTGGVGVNVNNPMPSGKITSCAEITGHQVSRREVLQKILDEFDRAEKCFDSGAAYFQGNRTLAAEWNIMAEYRGAQAAVVAAEGGGKKENNRVLARGIFDGIDPAGRCILKPESGKGTLYFNPGPVSLIFS